MTIQNLENYIKEDLGIPYVNLEGMNVEVAYEIADALTTSLVIFPTLAYSICSIGTKEDLTNHMNMLLSNEFGKESKWYDYLKNNKSSMLTARVRCGLLNRNLMYIGIGMDKSIYDSNLKELNEATRKESESGTYPKKCSLFKSYIFCEIGHILTDILELDKDIYIKYLISKYAKTEDKIKEYVSTYAASSNSELIAEIIACYIIDPYTNPLITNVGKYIESKYQKQQYDNKFNINYRYKRHKESAERTLELRLNKENTKWNI